MARAMENLVLVVIMGGIAFLATTVGAQVHHVVGGARGWDIASDLQSWSYNRRFCVGDNIWFTFSAAQDGISELRTKEEFESCDVDNPIKMYTDGINAVALGGEGTRYFVSSKKEDCRNGLKLHVEVLPKAATQSPAKTSNIQSAQALAAGPTPSASVGLSGMCVAAWFGAALVFFMG